MNAPQIRTRKPTGAVPWPLVLVEGPEKSGKSWMCAEFTADQRIGQSYWIDLGEGSADEYAAIDGADYLVVDHNGTWPDIIGQVTAIHTEAGRAHAAGENPTVLIVDSMSAEWDMLKDWVGSRARESNYAKRLLAKDPDAEIKPAMNYWNDANDRHGKLMRLLMTFPGIVVVTARGKEVAKLDSAGKPMPNEREYKVEGHKSLAFDASAWVRLSRDAAPLVVGARSVNHGVQPGVDKPRPVPDLSIAKLVFDVLKCDPRTARVRDLRALDGTDPQAKPPVEEEGRRSDPKPSVDLEGIIAAVEKSTSPADMKTMWTTHTPHMTAPQKAELNKAMTKRLEELRAAESETSDGQMELGGEPGTAAA